MAFRALIPVAALVLTVAIHGCAAPDGRSPLDPQRIVVDADAPRWHFDGRGGGIVPVGAWAPPRPHRNGYVSTIAGRQALLWIKRPLGDGPWDLTLRCRAADAPDEEQQTVTVSTVEGREMSSASLPARWTDLRLPLDADTLTAPSTTLRLDMAWAIRDEDDRLVAASCTRLGIAPRRDPSWTERPNRIDESRRRVQLHTGSSMTTLVPASSQIRIHPVEMTGCATCEVVIETFTGDDHANATTRLWQGHASDTLKRLEITTPPGHLSTLRYRVIAPPDTQRESMLTFAIPEPWIESQSTTERPLHVFLYVIDTLRADALEVDTPTDRTPEIAAFARDAVTYTRARSSSAWTLPATTSILTGTYADRHGMMRGDRQFTGIDTPPLATRLGALDYRTLAISHSFIAGPRFGLFTGFDTFLLTNHLGGGELRSAEIIGLLASLLTEEPVDRPHFVYLHTVDPHAPYTPNRLDRRFADAAPGGHLPDAAYQPLRFHADGRAGDADEVAYLHALYTGEVAHADRSFGRFLDLLRDLDLYDHSLVILASDHGEEFAEHGGFDHGRTLWEEMVRVPLLVKYPDAAHAGTRIDTPVSVVDIAATVLALVDRAAGQGFDGRPLPPIDTPQARLLHATVDAKASELRGAVDLRAAWLAEVKCLESGNQIDQHGKSVAPWRLFDLTTDPTETTPLPLDDRRATRCRNTFASWLEQRGRADYDGPTVDAETTARLRALGYL
ncbi:MAG: sulfatase [Acidobacteriota bacterium]